MKNDVLIEVILCLFSKLRPAGFKRLMYSLFLDSILVSHRLKSVFSDLYLSVFLVSGVEKHTGKNIRLLFVGKKQFPFFLTDLFFYEKPLVLYQGKVFICNIKTLHKRYPSKVDAVIVSCDQFYQRFLHQDDFLVFPHMADMVLETSHSLNELVKTLPHSAKQDVRMVRKNQFSFEIVCAQNSLDMFYYEMYLPSLKNIVGETDAYTPDFMYFRLLGELGYQLMMIRYLGRIVGGAFFKKKGDRIEVKYAGVLQGDIHLTKKGTSSAIYYFFMVYAKDHNINKVSFGGARPFFNDGLYIYKQKWGMSVEPYPLVSGVFGLKRGNDAGVRQFLLRNPFIGISKNHRFTGYVFVDKDSFTDEMRGKIEQCYHTPGIDTFRFIEV